MKLNSLSLINIFSISALPLISTAVDTPPTAKKPNVLFIAVDDLKPLLGCYGTSWIKSPNIDRLAAKGTVFTANYCQVAFCAPTRFSLLTGLRPDTTGVYLNPDQSQDMLRTRLPDVVTLPQFFKNHGYITHPLHKVFDGRTVDAGHDRLSWTVPYGPWELAPGEKPAPGGYQDPVTKARLAEAKRLGKPTSGPATEGCDIPDNAYHDGGVAYTAAKRIREFAKKDEPFFLAVGFVKPHLPFIAPKKYWDLYDRSSLPLAPLQELPQGSPHDLAFYSNSGELRDYSDIPKTGPIPEAQQRELIHGYAACVSYIDALVGMLMDTLEECGVADDTIICLWGDNGWHLGEHGHWGKLTNYEDAARAPLIISAAGLPGGKRITALTEFLDVYPTLCELADFSIPAHVEGKSLVPVLRGESSAVHEAAITQMWRRGADPQLGWSLRTPRYRYIEWRRAGDLNAKTPTFYAEVTAVELYDYERDPLERVNLADNPEYKTVLKEHQKLFDRVLPDLPERKLPVAPSWGPVYFSQDFSSSTTVANYASATPGTNKFNSIGATAPDAWSISGGALQLTKGGAVASTLNRTTALGAAPLTLFKFQFDVGFAFTGQTANKALGFFELYNSGPASVWGSFGFQTDSTGADNTWRVTGGTGGFTGVKTVTVYVNDTGSDATYIDPLGAQRTITNTFADIWVGNTLARSKVIQNLNTASDINGFRFVSPANGITSGTLIFDDFRIEQIQNP